MPPMNVIPLRNTGHPGGPSGRDAAPPARAPAGTARTPDAARLSLVSAIEQRTSAHHFKPDALPPGVLDQLLDLANRAPSAFNLQPWHFVVVQDPALRRQLQDVALGQGQPAEAPATVVFVADPDAWQHNLDDVIASSKAAGAMNDDYEKLLRTVVPAQFDPGPLGLRHLFRRLGAPILRLFKPTPTVPSSDEDLRAHAVKNTMFAAENFVLAATAAGLDTCPMEGFDEERLKALLDIPERMSIPLMIPIGHATSTRHGKSPRLPVERKIHQDGWEGLAPASEARPAQAPALPGVPILNSITIRQAS